MAGQRSFLNAVKWAYTANWGERAFSSLFTFLLAALLGPREFGVVSVAMIYIAFIQMFMNQGLVAALIQKKDLQSEHLNSVFWMNLMLGLGFGGLSILFSGFWAAVNHAPELSKVILVLTLCIPIEGLALVQMALLQRDLDFKSLSIRANVSVLIGGIVGIAMAYKGLGAWAIVGQQLIKDTAALTLLWTQSKWRPKVCFSWHHLKELVSFSSSNFAAQLGVFADLQSGAILLSILFGPAAVGLFRLAERVVSSVLSIGTSSIQAVSLPEFSRLQDKPEELRKSVLTIIRFCAALTLPAMAGLIAVSDDLMASLGPKWMPASEVLRILSVLGVMSMFSIFTGPLLQALSRPHHLAVLEWVRTLVGGGALCIAALLVKDSGIQSQIAAIASARLAVGGLLVLPVFLWLLLRLSGMAFTEVLAVVTPSAVSAVAVLVPVMVFHAMGWMSGAMPLVRLASEVAIGGIAGVTALLAFDAPIRSNVSNLFYRKLGHPIISKGWA
jgi:O-antigen/teichoic acid export membrane protein